MTLSKAIGKLKIAQQEVKETSHRDNAAEPPLDAPAHTPVAEVPGDGAAAIASAGGGDFV